MASPLQDLIKQIQDLATDVGNLFQLRGFKAGGTAGQVPVKTDGTDFNWSWGSVSSFPDQTGNNGKFLTTNGTAVSWATVDLSTYATTAALAAKKGIRAFDDEAALLAATPEYVGQLAYQIDTAKWWSAYALGTGEWTNNLKSDQIIAVSQFTGPGTGITGLPLTTGVTGTLPAANGGTGVANTGKTLTLGGSLTTTGTGAPTLAFGSGGQTITFPTTSATLARTDAGQIFAGNQTISGVVSGESFAFAAGPTMTTPYGPYAVNINAFGTIFTLGEYYGTGGMFARNVKATYGSLTHGVAIIAAGTEFLTLSSSGNFGIGNTSPSEKISVTGNAAVTGTLKTGSYTAAAAIASSHATAVAAGVGAQTFISDTGKAAWAHGSPAVWKYADGTTVT